MLDTPTEPTDPIDGGQPAPTPLRGPVGTAEPATSSPSLLALAQRYWYVIVLALILIGVAVAAAN